MLFGYVINQLSHLNLSLSDSQSRYTAINKVMGKASTYR